ncbi:hypothetical protein F4778DRAFT_719 [Xylariomycetidae sp. FL2044]|nr:hypothetical protein F4778DRAFT_719 [Xylariomycetidae sp. FL2044]
MTPRYSAALALLGAVNPVSAFWRMECRSSTGSARLDPIVDFGVPSAHAHIVFGSSGFSLDASFEELNGGSCTSCAVKQDKSAYWTPIPYFHDTDTDEFLTVPNVGGMLAYYLQRGDNVKAFPKNFQMIAGSNYRRAYTVGDPDSPDPPQSDWAALGQTSQDDLEQRAIGFNCLNYAKTAEASLFRHKLPDQQFLNENCPDGVRMEMMFPSCWNGETDSHDHKSHVAYPDLVGNGNCPDTHPQRLVTLFYETIWNTNDDTLTNRTGEFVISNGDPTGFGYHADFMNGWEEGFLQEAIDTCTNESGELSDCPTFTSNGPLQELAEMQECKFDMPSILTNENCLASDLAGLPGGIKIQAGPESATPLGGGGGIISAITSLLGGGSDDATSTTSSEAAMTYVASSVTPSSEPGLGGAFLESSSAAATPSPEINVMATAAEPSTTSAPSITSAPGVEYQIVSTQTITSGAQVEEIVWKEPVVYVTEDTITTVTQMVKSGQKARREHVARHRHHGRRN